MSGPIIAYLYEDGDDHHGRDCSKCRSSSSSAASASSSSVRSGRRRQHHHHHRHDRDLGPPLSLAPAAPPPPPAAASAPPATPAVPLSIPPPPSAPAHPILDAASSSVPTPSTTSCHFLLHHLSISRDQLTHLEAEVRSAAHGARTHLDLVEREVAKWEHDRDAVFRERDALKAENAAMRARYEALAKFEDYSRSNATKLVQHVASLLSDKAEAVKTEVRDGLYSAIQRLFSDWRADWEDNPETYDEQVSAVLGVAILGQFWTSRQLEVLEAMHRRVVDSYRL